MSSGAASCSLRFTPATSLALSVLDTHQPVRAQAGPFPPWNVCSTPLLHLIGHLPALSRYSGPVNGLLHYPHWCQNPLGISWPHPDVPRVAVRCTRSLKAPLRLG